MDTNPYEALAAMIPTGGGPPAFRRGTVLEVEPVLKVEVAGTVQTGNIYVNETLLKGPKRKYTVEGSVRIDSDEEVSGEITGDLELKNDSFGIEKEDEVLLLSESDQSFILICKLVKP